MNKRKLATAEEIINIQPIPNADAIEVATIKGWNVVVKKNEFSIGDVVVYFEIDSWIPEQYAPFLTGDKVKSYNGVEGNRLKTIKLRKQISQGLILALSQFEHLTDVKVGDDLTELLNIQKWEKLLDFTNGIKGSFPDKLVSRTDEERIQNLDETYWKTDETWYMTEKLDGSSCTIFGNFNTETKEYEFGVCSRNNELICEDSNPFWSVVKRLDLQNKMTLFGKNIALQGELCGPKIQKNLMNLTELDIFIYNVWDIDNQCHFSRIESDKIINLLGLRRVPDLGTINLLDHSITSLLNLAEGFMSLSKQKRQREGVVIRTDSNNPNVPRKSFKVISNKFLLKGGD